MDIFGGINEILKTLSSNKGSRLWFVFIVITVLSVGWVGKKYFFPEKPKIVNECDYLMEQNKTLVNMLLHVKNNLDSIVEGKPISYKYRQNDVWFAIYLQDTLPKKKEDIHQQQLKKVSKEIDSVLMKNYKYLDSVKQKQSVKQKSL